MKKIIFLMLLLPTVSFANNNDIGVHYTSWDLDNCCTVDGFGVDYSGLAGDNSLLVDLTYDRLSEGGVDDFLIRSRVTSKFLIAEHVCVYCSV